MIAAPQLPAGAASPFRPGGVRVDADFQRILALPRVIWQEAPDLRELCVAMNRALRVNPCAYCAREDVIAWLSFDLNGKTLPGSETPGCPSCGRWVLNRLQVGALRAIYDHKGAFVPARAGAGKTLISLLAPTLLRAKRPVLIVPASLLKKTFTEARKLSSHFAVHPAFLDDDDDVRRVLTYEEISHKNGSVKIVKREPDVLGLDEVHAIKNRSAARSRKIANTVRHFKPIVFALSATPSGRKFSEYWGPLKWALGAGAPLPLDLQSYLAWSGALDDKLADMQRIDPGPLCDLTPGDLRRPEEVAQGKELTPFEQAQRAFGRRFVSAPGVISTADDVPPCGLVLTVRHLPAPAPIKAAIEALRARWETPDGHEFEHALELWSRERWMSRGGWYRWEPYAPDEWLLRRRGWHAAQREVIKHSNKYFSEGELKDAVRSGAISAGPLRAALTDWEAIEPTFEPNSVWQWLPAGSYVVIEDAVKWLRENPERGIVWSVHAAVGSAIAHMAGVPYYAAEALDQNGNHIMNAKRSCVASMRSCGQGQNLQWFNANYFAEWQPKGDVMEQALARTHRDYQLADEITAVFPVMTVGDAKGLLQAIEDCRGIENKMHTLQKLVYGTWIGAELLEDEGALL